MRRLLPLLALLLVCGATCASTLRLRATAPSTSNDGSCALPVYVPMTDTASLWVHFAWTSVIRPGAVGHDSVSAALVLSQGGPPS